MRRSNPSTHKATVADIHPHSVDSRHHTPTICYVKNENADSAPTSLSETFIGFIKVSTYLDTVSTTNL